MAGWGKLLRLAGSRNGWASGMACRRFALHIGDGSKHSVDISSRVTVRTVTVDTVAAAVLGLAVAALWAAAAFELCGFSGCGGGGFGRTYSPESVLSLLLLSGIAASAVARRRACSRPTLAVAGMLVVLVPFAGGLVIGAGLDGYPRSVSVETRERELDRQRRR